MGISILTVDAGTTSVKVSLFDTSLRLLSCSVQEYSLRCENATIEADASVYSEALTRGAKAVLENHPSNVGAICITTQGETMALFDESGTPLTPFIVWLDSRAEHQAQQLSHTFSSQQFYEETGLPELGGALPIAKAMWLREHCPEAFSRTYKILLLEDYLLHLLCGCFVSEKSLQTSTGWFSLEKDDYWQEGLAAAQIPIEKLPELVECGTCVGKLNTNALFATGLSSETLIVCGAMDQTAAALAAGCLHEGIVTETTGTALVMAACTQHPHFATGHHVTIYRHALAGKYLYLPIGNTAGMALKWFRQEFCKDLPQNDYKALDALAQNVAAGCDGLVFLPFLEGCVDPDSITAAKGVFYGATLGSTRAHFARAIFESVAFLLRDFLTMLSSLGVTPTQVLSLGGGSRSALWQQIKADVCGIPFCLAPCSEAASQGAALLALWALKLLPHGTLPKALEGGTRFTQAPDSSVYQAAYERYQKLYKVLAPFYTTL